LGERGAPDQEKRIGDAGPRVWETWKETHEVYLPDSSEPLEWNAPQPLPAGLKGIKPQKPDCGPITS